MSDLLLVLVRDFRLLWMELFLKSLVIKSLLNLLIIYIPLLYENEPNVQFILMEEH